MMQTNYGPTYTNGESFRARAEARQRHYRAETLAVGWRTWGHWLDDSASDAGANFVVPTAHEAARLRAKRKGVDQRTFDNMLSSQAMCFNLFTPLARDTELATRILSGFVPGLATVEKIHIEYTPPDDLFGDQSGRGGVDCDVLIEATWQDGCAGVVAIETKFVEREFSGCGFRKAGRAKRGSAVCPTELVLAPSGSNCLYTARKHYRYWDWTHRLGLVRDEVLRGECPFGGPLWQLWVNHALAAAEASRRGAAHAAFGVCAPVQNTDLLDDGVLERFTTCLSDPSSFFLIPLDDLIAAIQRAEQPDDAYARWCAGIEARYAAI